MTLKKSNLTALAGASLIAIATAAPASAEVFGNVGFTGGFNSAREVDVSTGQDKQNVSFGIINGEFAYHFGSGATVAVDGFYRFDGFGGGGGNTFSSTEDPQSEFTVGVHVSANVGQNARAGLFFGYGDTTPQDGDKTDAYDVAMVGVEHLFFLADNVMSYAQVAAGSKVRPGEDVDEGFNMGAVVRFGTVWFRTEDHSYTLDVEVAGSSNYIDSSDPGIFFGVTLSGEKQLGFDSAPMALTYFARYDFLSATDEGDNIEELQVGVGLKLLFGNKSKREAYRAGASLGTPRLPTRASAWTEWMD